MTTRTDQRLFYTVARAHEHPGAAEDPTTRFLTFDAAVAQARRDSDWTGQAHVVMGVLATVQPTNAPTRTLP